MKTPSFWKSDWLIGLLVAVLFLGAWRSDLVQSLERKAYDLAVNATSRTPSDRIAVFAIDDASIDNIGRWPWSREVLAKLTDTLAGAKAKVIAYGVFLPEPQTDRSFMDDVQLARLPEGGMEVRMVKRLNAES